MILEDRAIERDRTRSSRNDRTTDEIPSRAARRRSGRRPPRILTLWARLTLLGLAVLVMALAAVGLVAKAIRPYREASLQSRQLAETRQQINDLDAQNQDLQRRIAYLKTTGGIVAESRKIGYLKPGEIPFVVEGLTPDAETLPLSQPAPAAQSAPHSRFRQLWRRLTGH